MKDRARARNAALSLAGRDIGELPQVVDPHDGPGRGTIFASSARPTSLSLSPGLVGRPLEGDRQDREGRTPRRIVCHGQPRGSGKTRYGNAPVSGPCYTATGTSLSGRQRRRPRHGYARIDQGRIGRQRSLRRIFRRRLSDPVPRRHRQPLQRANSIGESGLISAGQPGISSCPLLSQSAGRKIQY